METLLRSNLSNKDINWINAAKALCIIFVYIRHCEGHYDDIYMDWPINGLFLTFYVNGFFFISGYLLFWKQLSTPRILETRKEYLTGGGKKLFDNIIFRIIIPSIIFAAIEFFPSCIIQGRSISVGYALLKTVGGMTYWFTSALVVAQLLLLVLFCTRKKNIWFYAIIVAIIGLIGLVLARIDVRVTDLWAWKRGLIAIIFLGIGGVYWKYERQIDSLMHWSFIIPLLVVYVSIVIGLRNYANPLISLCSIQPLGFVTSIIGCLFLVWMCKKLPVMKSLTFIGQNSLGFYFMSGALPITLSKVAHALMPGTYFWMMIAIFIISLGTAFVTVMGINRWLPWMWDLRRL